MKVDRKWIRLPMMKAFWSKTAVIAAIAGAALFPKVSRTCAPATVKSQNRKPESPLACNAWALSSQERDRHFNELDPALRSLKKSVRELDDGCEFEFPGDQTTLQLLAEWGIQERVCCPFFEINLRFESGRGNARLRLTGRKGAKEIIRIGAAAWLQQ
jgi:hypothetical protein